LLFTRYLTALVITLIGLSATASAQDEAFLLAPAYQYAKKKTSYIILKSGEEIEGKVKKFKSNRRGLLDYILIEDAASGKERELPASRIKSAYLFPSAASRITSFFDKMEDTRLWDKDLDEGRFKEGYVYLETVLVQISKKKKEQVLLQLLNPHFADGIRIYDMPGSSDSKSIGIGPMKMGGTANYYYVMKPGDRMATILSKAQYKKEFDTFFGDCPSVLQTKKPRWKDLAQHAFVYANQCAEAR
jgi:hypothetical protein